LGGARALGLDTTIGSIAPGKAADLCAVSLNATELSPCYDPVSHLVYTAGRENISDVWVAGRIRVEDGQLLENNEIELIKLAALWQNKIRPRKLS
jgi:5-methylthioadenosine/S-adenosylhomocysteine deaminase